jgi:hypothetical protein
MRKLTILAAGVAVALAASTARAQNNGLVVWFDVRPTAAAITAPVAPYTLGTSTLANVGKKLVPNITPGNAGRAGDAAILFLSPELPLRADTGAGAHCTKKGANPFVNNSQQNLYAYMTVGDRAAGIDEVIGALGLDIDIVKGGAAAEGTVLEGVTYAANAALWDGENSSVTDNGGGVDFTIATKAVRVPVAAGPVFDATGATPGTHQVATIGLNAGDWDKVNALATPQADNTWTVRNTVNNLLVTRVYNGAGPTPELPDFGYVTTPAEYNQPPALNAYTTGTDEEAAGGDGSTVGTTSTQADALIIVIPKGDFSNDNAVTAADIGGMNAAIAAGVAARQREVYLGDYNVSNSVSAADIGGFNATLAALAGACPCNDGCP